MTKQQKILLSEDYLNACEGALAFIGNKSLEKAWEMAARPDWMCWLLEKIGYSDRRSLVLIATRSIRETPIVGGKFVFDLLPPDAVVPFLVIERYALGEDISKDEISRAAEAAAYAAYAAEAAAYAAEAAYAAYAAARAARAAREIQCDIIRSIIKWSEVSKLINEKIKELGIE